MRGIALFLGLATLAAYGQREQSIRARIRGGGGEWGKCTAEVDVDDVAEVSISGDDGRIVTLSGQPSFWRRLECTGPMPREMRDFRFRGVDGRGRQILVQDPRENRGVAVVRIEDPKAGREGYTFDIEWRGGVPERVEERPRWREGWFAEWGDEIRFRGRGRGGFWRDGGQRYEIYNVEVFVNRERGRVEVTLDTNRGRDSLAFTGEIRGIERDVIRADVRSSSRFGDIDRANGEMFIRVDRDRHVRSLDMNGRVEGGRFGIRWND